MARRSKTDNPDILRKKLIDLLTDFEVHLKKSDLRIQVKELIPATHLLRDLGSSLMKVDTRMSARERILEYFKKYAGEVVDGDEIMVISGISEYGRRIREIRVQEGWPILSGLTARDLLLLAREDHTSGSDNPPEMTADQYMLVSHAQDRDAAHRWYTANRIRKMDGGVQDKLLQYFRENVGKPITSEELRYIANDKSEWARRTRELRTEEGWPIVTRFNGDPRLPVGVYVLAREEQAPAHDRHIREITRREVMESDEWRCQWRGCGWSRERYDRDPRYLEVHHIIHHAKGGKNVADNLVTLCNLHHDETHRTGELDLEISSRSAARSGVE